MEILSPQIQAMLERARFPVRNPISHARQGQHRSPWRGSGVEFSEHRPYVAGDDARNLDWGAFARTGQLLLKQYAEERDARVVCLLDSSASMASGNKWRRSVEMLAAVAFTASKAFDRVVVHAFADALEAPSSVHTRSELPELARVLSETQVAGQTAFYDVARTLVARGSTRSLYVVISDLMTDESALEGLRMLAPSGPSSSLWLIHIAALDDLAPKIEGELQLVDRESNDHLRVHLDARLRKLYQEEVESHIQACRTTVERAGGAFSQVRDDESLHDAVVRVFFGATNTQKGPT